MRDQLLYHYMRPYPEEKEIVSYISSLSVAWFLYINHQTPYNLNNLNEKREVLFALTKINEIAYWRFLSDHYKLSVHGGKQFDYFYSKTRTEFTSGGFCINQLEEKH